MQKVRTPAHLKSGAPTARQVHDRLPICKIIFAALTVQGCDVIRGTQLLFHLRVFPFRRLLQPFSFETFCPHARSPLTSERFRNSQNMFIDRDRIHRHAASVVIRIHDDRNCSKNLQNNSFIASAPYCQNCKRAADAPHRVVATGSFAS